MKDIYLYTAKKKKLANLNHAIPTVNTEYTQRKYRIYTKQTEIRRKLKHVTVK